MSNLADLRVGLLLNDVSFKSQISESYRHAGRESERFSRKAQTDSKKVAQSYGSLAKSITNVAGRLALITGASFSLSSILSETTKYGQALSDLSAITGATKEQLKSLDDTARALGKTTEFGAIKVAESMKVLASAKPDLIKTANALQLVTEKLITLAQASGVELPEAAKSLALSLNQFGASASEAERYINVLAAGSKYGSSEITETAEAIKKSGTIASQAGIGFEQLNASIQVLAGKGIKGAEAGTMMRNVILALERSTDKNLKPSVVGLSTALDNLSSKNYSTTASTKLFGRANVTAAAILTQNRDKVDGLTKALTGTQTAHDQAAERANNLSSDLDLLASSFKGMAIEIGRSADGPMRSGVQNVTSTVNLLTDNFSTLANIVTYAVLPVMGARMTSGLQNQAKAWIQTGAAARESARQTRASAQATMDAAKASRDQAIQESRRLTAQKAINMQHGVTANYQKEYAVIHRQITEANKAEAAAKARLIAMNRQLSFSQQALNASSAALRGTLALVGGPVGAAMLAGSAIYYFHNKAVEARDSALNLKDAVMETTEQLRALSKVKVEIKIDSLEDQLKDVDEQTKIITSKLENYSDIKIKRLENRSKGALSFAYSDPEEAKKTQRELKGQLEDLEKSKANIEAGLRRANEVRNAGVFDVPNTTKPPTEDPPPTGGGNNLPKNKSTKSVSQYQQIRKQIESENAASLERISISEADTLRKLQEMYKEGGMKQGEFERLKTLNSENHMKQRVELAEKYSPTRASIRSEQEANKELKSLLDARLLSEQEYQYARLQLERDATKNRLSEQAKGLAMPNISILGDIDPVIQLKNQLEEQKSLYQAFYNDGLVSKERYEQLMTAANHRSKEAQLAASKELYAAQGDWQQMQMNLLETVEQRTSNSLTGLLTGSKSFSESLQDLSASLAQSIIQDLVKIAMQAMITNALTGLMGGLAGGAAGGSAAGAGASSSASTGAMGMPTGWKGYSGGGYTGNKGVNEISGVVHGQEYVFDAEATKNIGVDKLASIHKNGLGSTLSKSNFGLDEFKGASHNVKNSATSNSQVNKIDIHQTIQVSGNGDQALKSMILEASELGAKKGSNDAVSRIQRDFQTRGPMRRTLER